MSGQRYAIGIDLGGTTIKAAIVDTGGNIIEHLSIDSRAQSGPSAVVDQLSAAVRELLAKQRGGPPLGIGIGAPGVVTDEGVVQNPPNFADWDEVHLSEKLKKIFSITTRVENDANVAAIAEARFGAGKEFPDFLLVIGGRGVGGGVILNRSIFHGAHGGAGEVGHVTIDMNGPQCNCGSRGCVESYIGQRYLSERTRTMLSHMAAGSPPSKIVELVGGNLQEIEPRIIAQAADLGDAVAREILVEAGTFLGYALASAVNILDLRVVIIGGGVSASPQYVYDAITSALRSRVLKPHREGVRVLKARLGNTAGMLGAASLVM